MFVNLFLLTCLKKVWKIVIHWRASWGEMFFRTYTRIPGWFKQKKKNRSNAIKCREEEAPCSWFFFKSGIGKPLLPPPFPVHYCLGLSFKTLRLYTAWKDSKAIIDSFIQNCLPGSLSWICKVLYAKLFVMMLTVGREFPIYSQGTCCSLPALLFPLLYLLLWPSNLCFQWNDACVTGR